MKMIKKFLVFAAMIWAVSFSAVSMAAIEEEKLVATCPSEVSELFEPLSQRFILALLGANASVEFLSAPEGSPLTKAKQARILKFTQSEAQACSAPFPAQSYKAVQGTLAVLYTVTVLIWLGMMSVYAFANFYSKQNSGDSEEDKQGESLILKVARSSAFMLLCAPLYSVYGLVESLIPDSEKPPENDPDGLDLIEYSPLHNILFNAIGVSINVAENIDSSFKSRYAADNPKYLIPEPSYKITSETKAILEPTENAFDQSIAFAMCVQEHSKGARITVDQIEATYSGANKHNMQYKYEGCRLSFSMAKNVEIEASLNFIKSIGGVKVELNYPKKERETFESLSRTLMDMSLGFAYAIYNEILKKDINNLNKNIIIAGNQELRTLKDWHSQCEFTFSGMAKVASLSKVDEGGSASVDSIFESKILAQYCLSKVVTQKLGYPKHHDQHFDFDTASIKGELPLSGRQYQTCSFSKQSGRADDYQSCLIEVCDNTDPYGKESGLFECSVLVDVSRKHALGHYFDKLGFVASPAMMLSRLGDGSVPLTPQVLLTSFAMSDLDYTRATDGVIKEINDELLGITGGESKSILPFTYYSYRSAGEKIKPLSPSKKMLVCFVNPSSVISTADGEMINCKHPMNELHDLGNVFLKMYAGFVTGSIIKTSVSMFAGRKTDDVKSEDESDDKNNHNKKGSNNKVKNGVKSIRQDLSSIVISKLAVLVAGLDIGSMINSSSTMPNWGLDSKNSPYWYDETSGFAALVPAGGAVLAMMMSGNIIDKNGKLDNQDYNAASRSVHGKMSFAAITILIIGFVAAYIIPIAPAAIFYATFIAIVANILALVFSATFHVIYALAGTGKDVNRKLISLLNKWLLVMVRLPLLVVGFYLSYSLMVTMMPTFALVTSDVVQVSGFGDVGVAAVTNMLQLMISMVLFAFVMIMVMFALFDAITGPFYLTRGLVFSDDSGEALGKTNSSQTIESNVKFFKSL